MICEVKNYFSKPLYTPLGLALPGSNLARLINSFSIKIADSVIVTNCYEQETQQKVIVHTLFSEIIVCISIKLCNV